MRSFIRHSARGRRATAAGLAIALPLLMGTAACGDDEAGDEGIVEEEGVGEEAE